MPPQDPTGDMKDDTENISEIFFAGISQDVSASPLKGCVTPVRNFFTKRALSLVFRPEPQQKVPSAPPPPPPPPPPPLPEPTPPEPEEEILGSDDEEQEDPADYCKGVCNSAVSMRVNIVMQVLTLVLGKFLKTYSLITEFVYTRIMKNC